MLAVTLTFQHAFLHTAADFRFALFIMYGKEYISAKRRERYREREKERERERERERESRSLKTDA